MNLHAASWPRLNNSSTPCGPLSPTKNWSLSRARSKPWVHQSLALQALPPPKKKRSFSLYWKYENIGDFQRTSSVQFYVVSFLLPPPAMLKNSSWLCIQQSLHTVIWRPFGILRIEARLAACKASALHYFTHLLLNFYINRLMTINVRNLCNCNNDQANFIYLFMVLG